MKIVSNIRYVIAEYLKYKYILRQIGGDPEENITVAVNESLITHENGNQIWLGGAIDTRHKHIRLDVLPARDVDNLKTFVKNHQEFVEKFKDKIKTSKTLEDLLDEGASFKEINRILKDENAER